MPRLPRHFMRRCGNLGTAGHEMADFVMPSEFEVVYSDHSPINNAEGARSLKREAQDHYFALVSETRELIGGLR